MLERHSSARTYRMLGGCSYWRCFHGFILELVHGHMRQEIGGLEDLRAKYFTGEVRLFKGPALPENRFEAWYVGSWYESS